MELVYDNVYMEQKKWEATTQITVENDIELSNHHADIVELLLQDVKCVIDEVKVGREQVVVSGKLKYQVLYAIAEENFVDEVHGTIPFEEVIHAKGAVPQDLPMVKGIVEDFHISRINHRKIELQSIVRIYAEMDEEKVIGCPCDIRLTKEQESIEKNVATQAVYQLKQKKKDVLRIKEEIELQAGYPSIARVLWNTIALREIDIRPMDGKVSVSGELDSYFLYETAGLKPMIKTLEKRIPFQSLIDSSACDGDRLANMIPTRMQTNVELKEDYDGEERIFLVEASLDLQVRIFAMEQIHILKDAYSVKQELTLEKQAVELPKLIMSGSGKTKIKDTKRIHEVSPKIVQLMHTNAVLFPEKEEWIEGKLQLVGGVQVQSLYATAEEESPYGMLQSMIPYSFMMEPQETAEGGYVSTMVEPRIESVEAIARECEEIEWKVVLSFEAISVGETTVQSVVNLKEEDLDLERYGLLPSMTICFMDGKTSLWEIGKQNYMSVNDIKKMNEIELEENQEQKPILIVKGSCEQ